MSKCLSGLNVMDSTVHTVDMGTKYFSATTRRTLMALMWLCLGERLVLGTTMQNTAVDTSTTVHCSWIFLHVNLVMAAWLGSTCA